MLCLYISIIQMKTDVNKKASGKCTIPDAVLYCYFIDLFIFRFFNFCLGFPHLDTDKAAYA